MKKIDLREFVDNKTFIRKATPFSFGTIKECEELFIQAFLLTDMTINEGEFKMLPEYKEIIEWLSDNKGKGLLMSGSNGRGKTAILKGVIPLIFKSRNYIMKPINSKEIDIQGFNSWLHMTWAILIDEVGKDSVLKDYGTLKDPVEAAIDHCEDHIKLLIITSNLSKKQLMERYGVRTTSRLQRLCKIVIFEGEDLRK